MCGIAGIAVAARRDRAAGPGAALAHGRRAPPPRPGRVRRLPRRARGPGARPPLDHRPGHRASSRSRTRTARSGSSSTARSSTTSSCAPSWRRSGTASGPAATPRSSSTPTRRGARTRSRASTGSGPSRCGTRRAGALVLARDRLGRPAALLLRARRAALLRQRGEGASSPRDPAIPRALRPASASREIFTFWSALPPADGVRGRDRARAGARARSTRTGGSPTAPYWRAALPRGRRGRASAARSSDAVDGDPRRARGGHAAADAARRRAGGQLPLRRARQLARRRARAAGEGRALLHLLAALRGRRVRRDALPAADGRAPRAASTARSRSPRRRHRPGLPRRRRARRAARSCAPRRRRCSCSRSWCGTPASRSC